MRVVGWRREREPGPRSPTPEEIRRSHELSIRHYVKRRGVVVRYRTHAEADADMRELLADAMAERALGLAARR